MNFFASLLCLVVFVAALNVSDAWRAQRFRHRGMKYSDRDPDRTCVQRVDKGVCFERKLRWYYDASLGKCTTFEYSGCGGNHNNFFNRNACEFYCQNIKTAQVAPQQNELDDDSEDNDALSAPGVC